MERKFTSNNQNEALKSSSEVEINNEIKQKEKECLEKQNKSYDIPENAKDYIFRYKSDFIPYTEAGLSYGDLNDNQKEVIDLKYNQYYAETVLKRQAERAIDDLLKKRIMNLCRKPLILAFWRKINA